MVPGLFYWENQRTAAGPLCVCLLCLTPGPLNTSVTVYPATVLTLVASGTNVIYETKASLLGFSSNESSWLSAFRIEGIIPTFLRIRDFVGGVLYDATPLLHVRVLNDLAVTESEEVPEGPSLTRLLIVP